MSQRPEHLDLELLPLDLINARLAKGEPMLIFSAGNLRGKLVSAQYLECLPSPTFIPGWKGPGDGKVEPCVQLFYIPRPRDRTKVTDPRSFNFTRKPVLFNIPVRILHSVLFLHKVEDMWMVNLVTSVKE